MDKIPFRVSIHLAQLSDPLVIGADLPVSFGALQRHP